EVGIDNKHPGTGLSHDDAEVQQRRTLPLTWGGAGDQDGLYRLIDAAERDVGAEAAIGFGKVRIERLAGQQQRIRSTAHRPDLFAERRFCVVARGIVPMTGALTSSSTVSGSRTDLVSRYSSRNTNPTPSSRAMAAASSTCGTGAPVLGRASAGSRTKALKLPAVASWSSCRWLP